MTIQYRKANIEDAGLLINIYNASFYSDYLRYGACPGYGHAKEMMEESISSYPKHIILCDNVPVGCVSCKKTEAGVYEKRPPPSLEQSFQGKGRGTQAVQFVKTLHDDWEKLTLVTPIDKKENVKFYAEKCGFQIVSTEAVDNVELARFVIER